MKNAGPQPPKGTGPGKAKNAGPQPPKGTGLGKPKNAGPQPPKRTGPGKPKNADSLAEPPSDPASGSGLRYKTVRDPRTGAIHQELPPADTVDAMRANLRAAEEEAKHVVDHAHAQEGLESSEDEEPGPGRRFFQDSAADIEAAERRDRRRAKRAQLEEQYGLQGANGAGGGEAYEEFQFPEIARDQDVPYEEGYADEGGENEGPESYEDAGVQHVLDEEGYAVDDGGNEDSQSVEDAGDQDVPYEEGYADEGGENEGPESYEDAGVQYVLDEEGYAVDDGGNEDSQFSQDAGDQDVLNAQDYAGGSGIEDTAPGDEEVIHNQAQNFTQPPTRIRSSMNPAKRAAGSDIPGRLNKKARKGPVLKVPGVGPGYVQTLESIPDPAAPESTELQEDPDREDVPEVVGHAADPLPHDPAPFAVYRHTLQADQADTSKKPAQRVSAVWSTEFVELLGVADGVFTLDAIEGYLRSKQTLSADRRLLSSLYQLSLDENLDFRSVIKSLTSAAFGLDELDVQETFDCKRASWAVTSVDVYKTNELSIAHFVIFAYLMGGKESANEAARAISRFEIFEGWGDTQKAIDIARKIWPDKHADKMAFLDMESRRNGNVEEYKFAHPRAIADCIQRPCIDGRYPALTTISSRERNLVALKAEVTEQSFRQIVIPSLQRAFGRDNVQKADFDLIRTAMNQVNEGKKSAAKVRTPSKVKQEIVKKPAIASPAAKPNVQTAARPAKKPPVPTGGPRPNPGQIHRQQPQPAHVSQPTGQIQRPTQARQPQSPESGIPQAAGQLQRPGLTPGRTQGQHQSQGLGISQAAGQMQRPTTPSGRTQAGQYQSQGPRIPQAAGQMQRPTTPSGRTQAGQYQSQGPRIPQAAGQMQRPTPPPSRTQARHPQIQHPGAHQVAAPSGPAVANKSGSGAAQLKATQQPENFEATMRKLSLEKLRMLADRAGPKMPQGNRTRLNTVIKEREAEEEREAQQAEKHAALRKALGLGDEDDLGFNIDLGLD